MKQIIEEVFEAEKKAGEIINRAKEKASQIRQSAEKDNSEKIARTRQKAKELIQETVEKASKEAELYRRQKLEQAENEKESILKNEKVLNDLVDHISNIIIAGEMDSFPPGAQE